MASTWTAEKFPQFESAIRRLTEQHRELEDEPLHLALAYLPRRNGREAPRGIFLFEVIGGVATRYGQSEDLFEAAFDAVPGLPTGFDQTLHLILTTPHDLAEALIRGWPLAREVADAVQRGDYQLLHGDAVGQKLLRQLQSAGRPRKRAARG